MSVLKLKQNGAWVPISVGAQGIQGPAGANGADGYTPVRGTDYWTATDIAEIKSYVDEQLGVIENGSY